MFRAILILLAGVSIAYLGLCAAGDGADANHCRRAREIVPRASAELLQSRFRKGLVSYKIIAGVGHNTVSDRPEYFDMLKGEP